MLFSAPCCDHCVRMEKRVTLSFRRAIIIACLSVAALPATAQVFLPGTQVIAEQAGLNAGFWTRGGSGGITEEVVSWSQTAGRQFNSAHASMRLHSTSAVTTAQGSAYLYSASGLGAALSSATLVTGAFQNPSPISVSSTTPSIVDLFGGATTLPLAAATAQTYFIVIVPAAGAAGDVLAIDSGDISTLRTTYLGGGVTLNPDQVTTGTVATPPSATTGLAPASPSTIIFSVAGLVGAPAATPSSVPAVGTTAIAGTAMLLALAGVLLFRRKALQ
jgi:hypothetical protein